MRTIKTYSTYSKGAPFYNALSVKFLPVPVTCVTILAMRRYSDWPLWLQVLVVAPHGLLLSAALWFLVAAVG